MQHLSQSPTDPAFVQDPYPFYDRARAAGDIVFWDDYGAPAAVSHRAVTAILKDRRLGREIPPEVAPEIPERLSPFYDVEAHSMLELEPPRHTRLRGLVLRAFTSRRIKGMAPEIQTLCQELIEAFPEEPFDLLDAYARQVPVIVIARLLGVPEERAPDLLDWSNAMVGMYQASRTEETEARAVRAAEEFSAFVRDYAERRRSDPRDDLITELLAAEEGGEKLSTDELVTTCILLLNAGHEATVHSMGNAVRCLLQTGHRRIDEPTVEELLRLDPPLHSFERWAYEDVELFGESFKRGDKIMCLLGAANRDPSVFPDPHRFDPARDTKGQAAFGAGIHFCVGAPLARLELLIGLRALFERCPSLALAEEPQYADVYHFHGLESLRVST